MKTTLEDQPVEGGGIAPVDGVEDESTWSQDQQKALETALSHFPKVKN